MKVDNEFWQTVLENLYDGLYFVDRDGEITYWNRGAERITGYTSKEMVGKPCWENVLALLKEEGADQSGTRIRLRKGAMADDLYHEEEVSLRHREGHRIPVMARVALIRNFQDAVTAAVVLFSNNRAMVEARVKIRQLEDLALLDPVTELGNSRYASARLQRSLGEFSRYGWPFGVLLISLDDFATITAEHGAKVSGNALKTVARTISGNIRSSDELTRWSDDQLLAILLNTTQDTLPSIAAKLRQLVSESAIQIGPELRRPSVSMGATLATDSDTVDSLLSRVEQHLLSDREAKGNAVTPTLHQEPGLQKP